MHPRRRPGPDRERSPVRRCPRPNVSIVHASQVVGMDEHPALALREKKDASILVATDLVRRGEADAVVTAGHTGAGDRGGDPPARAPAGRRPAGPGRPDDHDDRAVRAPRHRGQPRLERREPLPVRRDGRPLRRAGPRRRAAAGRAPVDRRGARQGRRPDRARRPSCSSSPTSTSSATSRARTSSSDLADVVVCDAVVGQRRDQVLRGPLDLHLRPRRRGVPAAAARPARVRADEARRRPDPRGSSTTSGSAGRRCSASRAR